jgi:predicted small secreted protein
MKKVVKTVLVLTAVLLLTFSLAACGLLDGLGGGKKASVSSILDDGVVSDKVTAAQFDEYINATLAYTSNRLTGSWQTSIKQYVFENGKQIENNAWSKTEFYQGVRKDEDCNYISYRKYQNNGMVEVYARENDDDEPWFFYKKDDDTREYHVNGYYELSPLLGNFSLFKYENGKYVATDSKQLADILDYGFEPESSDSIQVTIAFKNGKVTQYLEYNKYDNYADLHAYNFSYLTKVVTIPQYVLDSAR